MSLYEAIAARLIGTPLQRPAEWLREVKGARFRRRHPELAELFLENGRIEAVLRRVLTPTTHCIDVGCHIGAYLQRFVAMCPQGHHYAVEPVPWKASWLRRKFPNVSLLQMALGDMAGTSDFFVDASQSAYSGTKARAQPGRVESLQVDCRRLDDVIPEDANIGLIKLDVNGGELTVLRGALRLLKRDRPFVLLGCTQGGLIDYGLDADEVHDFLVKEAGFGIHLLKDYLSGGEPLSADAFRHSMTYPFQAFNYAVTAASTQDAAAAGAVRGTAALLSDPDVAPCRPDSALSIP